ncbi:UDP-galactose transporter [Radiomyces spectabilis]|uniref:UDP-galactose transporter n=1 Tax=Radiomyces spectabilis TaxID=64574 RepID=UPI00222013BB|nr:UDP-galactose transporter [Radiomyces spectabilis]KAI8388465.1 UDP-galactose transporter [Radiomyces spectabilis]
MRYTRASVPEDQRYLASTAVIMSELIKTLVCMIVLYMMPAAHQRSLSRLATLLQREVVVNWRESSKLALPAFLYLIQNNLQYVAATNLDAATFQVTYQLKILTTAFFSVVILKRSLNRLKWCSLALLTFGIGLVVLPKDASLAAIAYFTGETEPEIVSDVPSTSVGNQSNMEGFMAVLMACVLSGLAGVYFEKILKAPVKQPNAGDEESKAMMKDEDNDSLRSPQGHSPQEDTTAAQSQLWIRNIQMSFFSVLLGLIFVVLMQDGATIAEKGFFVNYTCLTWVVILIQAFGGLIVALVVKYADNILKGFATSISIILSSLVSVWLFNFVLSGSFVLGAIFVIYATYLYGL